MKRLVVAVLVIVMLAVWVFMMTVANAAAGITTMTAAAAGSNAPADICDVDVQFNGDVASALYQTALALGHGPQDPITRALFAAALVESGMTNPDYGDRDSLGVLQQRPSAGWGTPDQVLDPVYAATAFILGSTAAGSKTGGGNPGARQELARLPHLADDPGALAQEVQVSAFPDRYNERLAEADAILARLAQSNGATAAAPCQPDDGSPSTTGPSGYLMPVNGAVFTSGFGQRWGRLHAGVDLAAPIGTPVYAAADGAVIHAGPAGGYGNAVYIDHGAGVTTRYGHLSAIYTVEGHMVQAGQIIGAVGSTGNSTGPHLHFEIRHGGQPINPAPLLGLDG